MFLTSLQPRQLFQSAVVLCLVPETFSQTTKPHLTFHQHDDEEITSKSLILGELFLLKSKRIISHAG